jgi:hypothetical protein
MIFERADQSNSRLTRRRFFRSLRSGEQIINLMENTNTKAKHTIQQRKIWTGVRNTPEMPLPQEGILKLEVHRRIGMGVDFLKHSTRSGWRFHLRIP